MGFHEVRFPTSLSFGSAGGPQRRTEVVTLANGFEERNTPWAHSRRRYDAGLGMRSLDDIAVLIAFFEARNGRLHGFRWKDWADYKSCLPSGTPAHNDQPLGIGDGVTTVFQLVKSYVSGAQAWSRAITKPVAGTVLIAQNGMPLASGWSVVSATGLVSFSAAPAPGAILRAGFEFDVPVRFDTDELPVTLDIERLGSIASIPLVEVRR